MVELQDQIGGLGGAIIAGLFILGALLSKFRVLWTRDSSDVAIGTAQIEVIKMLREENKLLHERVMDLQQEVAKLQLLVAELTLKLRDQTD